MSNYNIVICSDNNYFKYVFVLLQSLFNTLRKDYGDQDDTVHFHIIVNDDVNIEEQKSICDGFSSRNASLMVSDFTLYHIDDDLFQSCSHWGRQFPNSKAAYYRLLIDKILPTSIDTVLYMDVDMLFVDDFRLIFDNNDVSSYLLGGVIDVGLVVKDYPVNKSTKETLTYDLNKYINSGLLLLNLKACREIGFSDQLMSFVTSHDVLYHDQTAINYLCYSGALSGIEKFEHGPICILDYKYNFMQSIAFIEYNSEKEQYDHYNGMEKCVTQSISAKEYCSTISSIVLAHFNLSKPWSPKVFGFTDKSCYAASGLFERLYCEWYKVTESTPEVSVSLSLSVRDVLINNALSDHRRLIRRRYRSNRKLIISIAIVLLLIQICFFILTITL